MNDEEFEKEKKDIIEKRGCLEKDGKMKNQSWKGFWNIRKEVERGRKEAQLIRDYLEEKAESPKEREKILQAMSKEVGRNWRRLKNAVLKESPDQEEVLKLLKSPLSLSKLPELIAFKSLI